MAAKKKAEVKVLVTRTTSLHLDHDEIEEALADWARKNHGFTSKATYSLEGDYGHNITFSIQETDMGELGVPAGAGG